MANEQYELYQQGTAAELASLITGKLNGGQTAIAPLLTAGAALGITGDAPTDSATWLQRVSTADGPTIICGIHGRTLQWNQLAPLFNDSSWVTDNATSTLADSNRTITVTSSTNTSTTKGTTIKNVSVPDGHKWLITAVVDASETPNSVSFGFYKSSGNVLRENVTAGSARSKHALIGTVTSDATIFGVRLATATPSGSSATFSDVQAFDLTQMFGAGNEPSTIEEFTALYGELYYPYDPGSLLSVNLEGIESTAADESWTQQRAIAVSTYFPNGMQGVGGKADELTAYEAVTANRYVESAGTFTPSFYNETDYPHTFLISFVTNPKKTGTTNFELQGYETVDVNASALGNMQATSSSTFSRIYIRNDNCSTTAEMKAALANVPLVYELATPTTTPIDQPLNLTYRTAAGGTERVMVPIGKLSAPPTIVAAQGYTAESLRDAALSAIAPVENGLASANYGVGSYLVHGGTLCKVTTAIATGEAIAIGTNVTATTVMTEVLSLIQ